MIDMRIKQAHFRDVFIRAYIRISMCKSNKRLILTIERKSRIWRDACGTQRVKRGSVGVFKEVNITDRISAAARNKLIGHEQPRESARYCPFCKCKRSWDCNKRAKVITHGRKVIAIKEKLEARLGVENLSSCNAYLPCAGNWLVKADYRWSFPLYRLSRTEYLLLTHVNESAMQLCTPVSRRHLNLVSI